MKKILLLLILALEIGSGCSFRKKLPQADHLFNEAAYNLGLPLRWRDDGDAKIEEGELSGLSFISSRARFARGRPSDFLQKLIDKVRWFSENREKPGAFVRRELSTRSLTPIEVDFSKLPIPDQRAIRILLDEAIPHVESIYLSQMDPQYLKHLEEIIDRGTGEDLLTFYSLGGSRCTSLSADPICSPVPGNPPPTPYQGFWPPDYSPKEHEKLLASIRPEVEALKSPFVYRQRAPESGLLVWKSFNAYPPIQLPQAALILALSKASEVPDLTPSIAKFLKIRALELTDQKHPYPFFEGDTAWIESEGGWDVTLGYYEEYHSPFKLNAIMEAFIGVVDYKREQEGHEFRKLLYPMEDQIAKDLGPEYHRRNFNVLPPLRFIDTVSAGDARARYLTLAFYLPNVKPYGRSDLSKKVLLVNKTLTRFNKIIRPMAELAIDPAQIARVQADDVVTFVIGHENAHGVGPGSGYIVRKEGEVEMTARELLGNHSSALEEARADNVGLASLQEAVRQGIMTQEQADNAAIGFVALLIRGLVMGDEDDHGLASILTFSTLLEKGGLLETPEGRYAANLKDGKIFKAAEEIGKRLNRIQIEGDIGAYDRWFRNAAGRLPKKMVKNLLPQLKQMPRDLLPYYRFKFSPSLEY